jgi:AcrR family transcriptional regulator
MQEIANEAGINKALLHYYFRSKDLLFERIFFEEVKKFSPILKNAIDLEVDLYQKINNICEAYIMMSIENPFVPVFVIGELNKQPDLFIQKMLSKHDCVLNNDEIVLSQDFFEVRKYPYFLNKIKLI